MRLAGSSSTQDGLWFQEKLDPSSAASTVCRAFWVNGPLELDALRVAWSEVLARHDILRTTLVEQHGRPVPRTGDEAEATLSVVDLTAEIDPRGAARTWLTGIARTPLHLAEGPLARLAAARLGVREHLVALVLHRAVCDADSVPILLTELTEGYAAALESPARQALPRPIQYADRARGRRTSPELAGWWTARLSPPPPALSLPVDRARPAGPSSAGDSVRFEWSGDLARSLAELSIVERTSPATVLLAAFQTLLHRYAAEDRVAVGTVVPSRPRPDFDGVVGPFENLLVLCGDLAGRPSFRELVGRVARQAEEATEHAIPFAELVRVLRIERDPRQVPLCQAMFVCPDTPEPGLALSGATAEPQPVHNGAARADLVLSIERVDPTVRGELEFRTSLLDRSSAARILGQLHTLLAAALAEPYRRIDELPLDRPEWMDENLARAQEVAAAAAPAMAAHELFHRHARQRPGDAAISWQGEEIGYGALAGLAGAIAGALSGVAGAPVVVRMPSGPRQIAASIAALDAGAQLACLGPGDAGERGRSVLAELRPACLVLDGADAEDDLAQWYRTELGGRVLDVAELGPARPPAPAPPVGLATRAYVTYTSGSTGQPKGIPQSHATLAQFVTWFSAEFGIGPGARVAQWAAPGYDASLVEMFAALAAGATLCPVPDRIRAHPEKIVDWLADNEITVFQTVPSFARQLLEVITARGDAGRLGALDHLLLAGEALPGELANLARATLPRVRLVNLYGPTESILATWHEITAPVHGTAPVGRSIPGRAVLVLDDAGRTCPAGVTGHIVIRSDYLTEGYLGAAAAERSAFQPGPGTRGYRTGDLGRLRFDGALEFRGRKDFQVKFNGMRMELTDIEAALRAHESVADCAVVALHKADGLVGRLVAYVVPRRDEAGKPLGAANSWRAALRNRFGKAMPPVSFQTIVGLPRTISGKVDRKALPAPGAAAAGAGVPPSAVRADLAAVWSDVLGGAEPDPDETFFAAGGHSLLIPLLLHRIRELFDVRVPLWDFFAGPTLTGVSAVVEAHLASQNAETATTVTG